MTPTEKMTTRIRALLDRAEHPNTTEHEADAAMAKAQELMLKHSIDEAKVRMILRPELRTPPVRREHDVKPSSGRTGIKALRQLINSIGATNRVRVLKYQPQSNTRHILIGFDSDVTFVLNLYESLVRQMEAAFEREPHLTTVNERKEFYWGFVSRVTSRLASDITRQERELVASSSETALALRDASAEVDAALARWYPKLRSASFGKYGQSNAGARSAGSAAGDRASLTGARGALS